MCSMSLFNKWVNVSGHVHQPSFVSFFFSLRHLHKFRHKSHARLGCYQSSRRNTPIRSHGSVKHIYSIVFKKTTRQSETVSITFFSWLINIMKVETLTWLRVVSGVTRQTEVPGRVCMRCGRSQSDASFAQTPQRVVTDSTKTPFTTIESLTFDWNK